MKISKALILSSVIILIGIMIYVFSNRYYAYGSLIIDRFTGKAYRISDMLDDTQTPSAKHEWTPNDFK